jgi:hypothetical protein
LARSYSNAQLGTTAKIKATTSQLNEENAVLRNGNSTYEQRATILGITDKAYFSNSQAQRGLRSSTNELSQDIRNQTKVFEDSIKPLERVSRAKEQEIKLNGKEADSIRDKIKALRDEEAQKIKAIQKGGLNDLEKQKKAIDNDIKALNIQKEINNYNSSNDLITQNINSLIDKDISGLRVQSDILELQISQKNDEINLIKEATREQEDQYNQQLDGIQKVAKTLKDQYDIIRQEIEDKKIQFDLNIEPAKRKLEELQQQSQNLSNSIQNNQTLNDKGKKLVDELTKDKLSKGDLSSDEILKQFNQKINEEQKTKGGKSYTLSEFFSQDALGEAFGNLVSFTKGSKDKDGNLDAVKYLDRLAKSTSDAVISDKNEALKNLAYGINAGVSGPLQYSGITENLIPIKAKGQNQLLQKAQAENNTSLVERIKSGATTEADDVQSTLLGLDKITADNEIKFSEQIESGNLEQQKFNLELQNTKAIIGRDLLPTMNEFLKALTPFVKGFSNFAKDNPSVVLGITGLVIGLSGLASVLSTGIFLFSTFSSIFVGLPALFALVSPLFTALSLTFGALVGGGGIAGVTAGIQLMGGAFLTLIGGPITLVIAAIAIVIGYMVYLYNTNESFRNKVNEVWKSVVNYVMWAKDNLAEALCNMIGFVISLPFRAKDAMFSLIKIKC